MSSNLPPGVTGSEPEIAGYPECPSCGCPYWDDEYCEECGHRLAVDWWDANENYMMENHRYE